MNDTEPLLIRVLLQLQCKSHLRVLDPTPGLYILKMGMYDDNGVQYPKFLLVVKGAAKKC